jgi:hypothetical protein
MTPSRILSLFDPMLPYETVCMCLSAYLGDKEDESATNPLISPAVASDDILSKFPSTLLVAAQVMRVAMRVVGKRLRVD